LAHFFSGISGACEGRPQSRNPDCIERSSETRRLAGVRHLLCSDHPLHPARSKTLQAMLPLSLSSSGIFDRTTFAGLDQWEISACEVDQSGSGSAHIRSKQIERSSRAQIAVISTLGA
jgi:hypothetical protein